MPTHLKELASLEGVVKCRRRNGQQQWRAHMKSLDGYGPRRLRKEDASGDLTRMRAAPTRADVLRIVAELRAEAMPAMIQSAKVSSTGSETRAKPRIKEAPRRKAKRTKYLPSSCSEQGVPLNEKYSSHSD